MRRKSSAKSISSSLFISPHCKSLYLLQLSSSYCLKQWAIISVIVNSLAWLQSVAIPNESDNCPHFGGYNGHINWSHCSYLPISTTKNSSRSFLIFFKKILNVVWSDRTTTHLLYIQSKTLCRTIVIISADRSMIRQ